MSPAPNRPTAHLVAFEQCGIELQAPHVRPTTKRRIDAADVEADLLPDDALRFTGWAPSAIEARFPGLVPDGAYELEATMVCERHAERAQRITSGDLELQPPIVLAPGAATVVRMPIPPESIRDGVLEVRVERVLGPDAVLSTLRLFSSEPPAPAVTVVGDSQGGLVGTVSTPDSRGVPGLALAVSGDAGALEVVTDHAGRFRVPLDGLGRAREGVVRLSTAGLPGAEATVDTRHVARGLRELPPPTARLDLSGSWDYHPGPFDPEWRPGAGPAVATVPGHIVYDGLVPRDGVGTLRRRFELPQAWAGRMVFVRCDGAYGRAEVRVNGALCGVHGGGATSFDVDITSFVQGGENELAVTLIEFTPQAVLDNMSWYAHMSLLGIWRDILLFSTPPLHLGHLDLDADWDPASGLGKVRLRPEAINASPRDVAYGLEIAVRDGGLELARARLEGSAAAGHADRQELATAPLSVLPWSAEEPRLYELEVTLRGEGIEPMVARRRIGFRRVEVRGDQLLVNGAPLRLRGVNRHDSRILKGRALSADDMLEDIRNLRQANVNVIRTSHYPPSPHLLDACEALGMFVIEQPPICFSGGFDDHHWTRTNDAAELAPYVLEVTAETVARDRGRCSVIAWDVANESRWGAAFDDQLALVKAMDATRPTLFSFDLNELGPENELVGRPAGERPDLRSYHYPGWDRTWQEDLDWLGSHEQPVVLDEYAPVFAPCLRGAGEGFGLAVDPGIRDYWGAGYQPFVEAALGDRGVIGGLVWGGFGEVFAIPLDLTIGQGPWAHLPVADYVRMRDHYPAEPGVFRRGDGDWGIFDAWNRARPEVWHVHQMYCPIGVGGMSMAPDGHSATVELANRFIHRSLAGLEVRVIGGEPDGAVDLHAAPGASDRLVVRRRPEASALHVEVWHPEGWLVGGWRWPWPGCVRPADLVLAKAEPPMLNLGLPDSLDLRAGGHRWLRGWPAFHALDVDAPHVPVACGRTDGGLVELLGSDAARAPIVARDWHGWITARVEGRTTVFEYDCVYDGARPFNAKEVGLTLLPDPELTDLWWRRVGEWSLYPPGHIGRTAGHAAGTPGWSTTMHPAARWEQDATAAGSNDYRSTKRSIVAAGVTDGRRSLTVVAAGVQHVRAELVDGRPQLHVLDWYGGVRSTEGNHPIWSAYFGTGLPIVPGSRLEGRVEVAVGDLPPGWLSESPAGESRSA